MATTEGDATDDRSGGQSAEAETGTGPEAETEEEVGRPTRRLRWRVTLGDALLGAFCLALGLIAGATAIGRLWWLATATGGAFVAGLYAAERGATARLDATQRLALLGTVLAGIALLAVISLLDGGPDATAAVALLGLGAGLLIYRFVFGVLLPIPRARFRRIDERDV